MALIALGSSALILCIFAVMGSVLIALDCIKTNCTLVGLGNSAWLILGIPSAIIGIPLLIGGIKLYRRKNRSTSPTEGNTKKTT